MSRSCSYKIYMPDAHESVIALHLRHDASFEVEVLQLGTATKLKAFNCTKFYLCKISEMSHIIRGSRTHELLPFLFLINCELDFLSALTTSYSC